MGSGCAYVGLDARGPVLFTSSSLLTHHIRFQRLVDSKIGQSRLFLLPHDNTSLAVKNLDGLFNF